MANTITRHRIFDYEQEEIIEKQLIAGEDGVVTEKEVLKQDYFHTWVELEVHQTPVESENRSKYLITMYQCATSKKGFTYQSENSSGMYTRMWFGEAHQATSKQSTYYPQSAEVQKGETLSQWVADLDSEQYSNITASGRLESFYHDFYGYGNYEESMPEIGYQFAYTISGIVGGVFGDDGVTGSYTFTNEAAKIVVQPSPINRAINFLSADNFNDEENPTITFDKLIHKKKVSYVINDLNSDACYEKITSLQIALSLDGVTADVAYRDIPIDNTSYTFVLTDAERELLREKAQGSSTVPIYYITKVHRKAYSDNSYHEKFLEYESDFSNSAQRAFTVIGCTPQLNPTVKDVNSDTLALTGNENIFVRYESMVEFSTGAVASKHATIVSQSVQCGSKIVRDSYYGVIDDIESGTFIFNATDSRGLNADTVAITNAAMVEYVKPTCAQKLSTELSGETGSVITLKVSGSYFNGSFGAVDNTLKLEVRIAEGNGEMGEWTTLTGTPTFKDNTYELVATFPDFSYSQAYTFQCRATDKLNTVQTSEYVLKLLPVFDWSEEDFNFNVPVNIDAEDLNMHGETVLRHGADTNNTVLSASGGHIYIRPKGTNNTTGETIIYPNGDIAFGGTVDLGNSFTIQGNTLNDFVVNSGTASMGSNGTWYWQQWASGKAEAWGCRNFGNMAVTTAWGNLFRSEILSQDLPDNVFKTTPDVININIVNATYGGWICKHETAAPSAATTGSFIFVRPASATVTAPTYIGFHVIGLWK